MLKKKTPVNFKATNTQFSHERAARMKTVGVRIEEMRTISNPTFPSNSFTSPPCIPLIIFGGEINKPANDVWCDARQQTAVWTRSLISKSHTVSKYSLNAISFNPVWNEGEGGFTGRILEKQ